MKYSIIIVAYKAQDYLQACLDSIIVSRSRNYEVIIVDNSPTRIEDDLGLADNVEYIYPWKNLGFAAACNLGAKHAQGEILCFLNPDTQVYCDWLERMSRYLVSEGGPCHAVGPVSNNVAGIQKNRFHFGATGTRETWQPVPTKVLIGFCLMIAKDTYDIFNGMDERCFLGCDDLDLSWRMREKNLKLGVATDVYIHHECHKSMEQNPDKAKLIAQSEAYLKTKLIAHYGPGKVPSATELWGADFIDTGYKPTVSVCMISGEEDIELVDTPIDAMDSVADEVSLTYTGADEFYEIHNDRMKYKRFPWVNDFAAARNHSLSHCTSDWIIWLDADDSIPQDTIDQMQTEGFRRLLHKHHAMIRFLVRNVGKNGEVYEEFMQTRMFRRSESHWEGRIHEHLVYDGQELQDCPVLVIDHTGYNDLDTVQRKSKRNLDLLAMEPETSENWMHKAHCYAMVGDWEQAKECFDAAIKDAAGQTADYLNYQIGLCLENTGNNIGAAKHYEKSNRVDGLGRLAEIVYRMGLPYVARPLFLQFLADAKNEVPGSYVSHTKHLVAHAERRLKEMDNG
jgi:GT2 family glycosyltransferase/tetratricopeptide (TPR) repeat protein